MNGFILKRSQGGVSISRECVDITSNAANTILQVDATAREGQLPDLARRLNQAEEDSFFELDQADTRLAIDTLFAAHDLFVRIKENLPWWRLDQRFAFSLNANKCAKIGAGMTRFIDLGTE